MRPRLFLVPEGRQGPQETPARLVLLEQPLRLPVLLARRVLKAMQEPPEPQDRPDLQGQLVQRVMWVLRGRQARRAIRLLWPDRRDRLAHKVTRVLRERLAQPDRRDQPEPQAQQVRRVRKARREPQVQPVLLVQLARRVLLVQLVHKVKQVRRVLSVQLAQQDQRAQLEQRVQQGRRVILERPEQRDQLDRPDRLAQPAR